MRRAVVQLWGEDGLNAVGRNLPEDARQATVDSVVVLEDWLPERFVMAWYDAVMLGPAKDDRNLFRTFIDRMMDFGFGAVRKLLLQLASPEQMASRCADLWRHDHSHGTLSSKRIAQNVYLFVLEEHVYTTTALSRLAVVEIYRYALQLTGPKDATAQHTVVGDALHVTLRFTR